jgi:hypothetical protein
MKYSTLHEFFNFKFDPTNFYNNVAAKRLIDDIYINSNFLN